MATGHRDVPPPKDRKGRRRQREERQDEREDAARYGDEQLPASRDDALGGGEDRQPDQNEPRPKPGGHHEPCECGRDNEAGCSAIALERNRYFFSKVMTARDFAGEQEFFLGRHRLHNRLLHGWGIVCGLEVKDHPTPSCQNTRVMVLAGIAIDCCGREIVLDKDVVYDLSAAADADPEAEDRHAQSPAVLCIRYHEEKIEHVPVLYSEEGCDPRRREANRIREGARLELIDWRDLPAGCWGDRGGRAGECLDCDGGTPASGCIGAACMCGDLVPLAVLRFDEGMEQPIGIDTSGRQQLAAASEQLTHIASVNWEHGAAITLDELVNEMNGRLEVRFDRKIKEADGEATGINAQTFVVQFVNIQRDLEFLPAIEEPGGPEDSSPTLADGDPCLAVFEIDRRYLKSRSGLAGSTVLVTLKCDFIVDCNDNAVDGNHIKGILPSGDGTQGGVFESWFRVVADRGYREAAQ